MSLTINDLFIGQVASMQRTFNESDVKLCNELTKDYSPIYQVNKEAWKSNFSKPIVPGLLTEGLITQVISEKLPGSALYTFTKHQLYCARSC
ncbi:hypothetical protein [Peribacillus simplex]|uniref:Uncharacterized protein n=2 Tax=Peribacillus simplex TaxID=1478 RepID=A0A223EBL8_9BACI|nr:hypothetical protein [Peribacillus simplex]ASS92642.1 hypothetical protein BS1321_00800 [Peribacillus simplex NBRC 15720 = DSM 1321]MEC1398350.1 hypothetical protein [Peribacillus simplex]MED3911662.1 hypothetical protein [Peribacillus simplex]MED3986852.1 hypothetical protein [Peribacillus simplex]MED4094756.1 hypothetical protein [Peribacillus simplex]